MEERREQDRVILCTLRWIRIWRENRKEYQGELPTDADALHSALLHRLLSGKEPLPEPPPLRYGYPDYEWAEENG